MSRPVISGREIVIHPLQPGESCEWCGDMLSEEACVGMRDAMADPERRKKLIEGLSEAFDEETQP